jgi:hypothetical protein
MSKRLKKPAHEELQNLYYSPRIIRMIKTRRWAEHVPNIGEKWNPYRILVEKPERKRPLKR